VAHPVPTKETMTTVSLHYNCSIRNGGNSNQKHVCPEAKGSSPTAGLALLWDRNPLRGNSDYWQISQEEAGRIIFDKTRLKCIRYTKYIDKYTRRDVADTKRNNEKIFNHLNTELNPICHLLVLLGAHHIFYVSGLRVNSCVDKGKFFSCPRYEGRWGM